jgi:hypothetical protein
MYVNIYVCVEIIRKKYIPFKAHEKGYCFKVLLDDEV